MGNQLVWQERYNIGVDVIDKEHKKLFGILNKLLAAGKEEEKSRWACQEGIKYFKDHAMKHFSEEEAYMASIRYSEFDTHKRLHDNFREKTLPALEKELRQTGYSAEAVNHFLGVTTGWLIGHTLTEDHAIAGGAASKWGDLLPEQMQAAVRQSILQLLNDLFQLEARVISECYGGERFGKGIYYRLNYENRHGERWEVMFVFEEKLIVNTIGSMIDTEANTVNVMMMNASRYTAQQFANSISEHLPSAELYEMKEENLLTYEQFHKVFERQKLQFSLLFDTGKGYFAYCVTAPHLIQKGEEISIKAENAMTEVKKYLDRKDVKKKKKILVVDDSGLVREAMTKLFGADYEVTTANSGLSAIRCITLNRPDLILLDYEMPVCDGSQVLEMIRAEEDFADIPVFFLTGRADKESVKKVIALKPAGYLVKTLQPAEIKKGIDGYFAMKK
ncbi:MAG: response regulator [Blautia sp.]|nr:response regulator [Blautia sp.]MCM1201772.1 response regulator [Bacteroides fragilis]